MNVSMMLCHPRWPSSVTVRMLDLQSWSRLFDSRLGHC